MIFFGRYPAVTPVKKLSSDPQNYPRVTFNKRYEGYRTVPSAVPYYRHSLYDRERRLGEPFQAEAIQQLVTMLSGELFEIF